MRNSIRKINESFFSQGILITSYQIKPLKLVGAYFIGIHYIAYIRVSAYIQYGRMRLCLKLYQQD